MEYTDRELTCVDCNESFIFSADDQSYHAEKGAVVLSCYELWKKVIGGKNYHILINDIGYCQLVSFTLENIFYLY